MMIKIKYFLCSAMIFTIFICASDKKNGNSCMQKNDSVLSLTSGDVSFSIDPSVGGRILTFEINGFDFLTGKSVNQDNYGSTLWPSPQSDWSWPPPAILDAGEYNVESKSDPVMMMSKIDPTTGWQFEKEFSAGDSNSILLKYSIKNISEKNKKVAPWEISRARKCGLLFYPAGEFMTGKKTFPSVDTVRSGGIIWYQDQAERPDNHRLSSSDGSEGWLAYAVDGKVFIKKFPDIKPGRQAPGEGEVLYYVSSTHDYIEIEIQGEYVELKPGEKTEWDVEWIAAEIPSSVKVETGNQKLVEFVRTVIKNR